jgi:cold shock CspA family protein
VVNREPKAHQSHQDPYVATRDAFRAARRQLEDYVRIHYRKKKRHRVTSLYGKVIRILLDRDGGFLKTPDGREIYFNRRSVLSPGFDALRPGDEVRFTEEQGEDGPQASSLSLS